MESSSSAKTPASTTQKEGKSSSKYKVLMKNFKSPRRKKVKETKDSGFIPSLTVVNSGIAEVTDDCRNLNLNSVASTSSSVMQKKQFEQEIEMKVSVELAEITPSSNILEIQEMFLKQIAPLYASNNNHFLNNLAHHPLLYGMANQNHVEGSPYMNNLLQHPLLRENVSNHWNENHKNKKRNRKKFITVHAGNKFEDYLSLEEVEKGLKDGVLFEGVLRINPKNFQHSYVASNNKNEHDIFIDGMKNRNRAMEGDVVVAVLLEKVEKAESSDSDKDIDDCLEENGDREDLDVSKQSEDLNTSKDSNSESIKRKGKIVYIKEKVHPRMCIGNLRLMPDKNRQKALFSPRDPRVPRLNVPCTSWPDGFYNKAKEFANTLFVAKITDWDDVRFAMGTIFSIVGHAGDLRSETKAILAENDLDVTPYGPQFKRFFPQSDYVIPDEEISKREDCRNICIFTIDPATARDLDDAVSFRKLESGNYEIGVHISDVSFFLHENTDLDKVVSNKATTVYLVEKAYHMLPEELCLLCSLLPGVDRLAFSVFWEMTLSGEVLSKRLTRTVIQSCCQLSYEHAQTVLDNRDIPSDQLPQIYGSWSYENIKETIQVLGKISKALRSQRFEGGALRIDQAKLNIHLDTLNGLPNSFTVYQSMESHQLIEEFMLLANMTVAEKIYADFPRLAFLRCHSPPSKFMVDDLAKSLKPLGIDLDFSTAGSLHTSLTKYTESATEHPSMGLVLSMLCAKPMTRARYFCADGCDDDDFAHYALNVPLYTHFTSPIRRYADVMVHRLLASSLNYSSRPQWPVDRVREIAANCNKQKFNAKRAGEKSVELYCIKYIELNSPVKMEAVVVDVKMKYIDVIVFAMALNRRIYYNGIKGAKCEYVSSRDGLKSACIKIKWEKTETLPESNQTIRIFSIVDVEMKKTKDILKIETLILRPLN